MLGFYVKLKSRMIDANDPTPLNAGTGDLLCLDFVNIYQMICETSLIVVVFLHNSNKLS